MVKGGWSWNYTFVEVKNNVPSYVYQLSSFVKFLENTFVFLDEMKLGASFEHKYCSIV